MWNTLLLAQENTVIQVSDFILDYHLIKGTKTCVQGNLISLGDDVSISDKQNVMSSVTLDTKGLSRDLRKQIMQTCTIVSPCLEIVCGVAEDVDYDKGLIVNKLGANMAGKLVEFQKRTQEKIINLTRSKRLQKIYKDALKLSKIKDDMRANLGIFIDKVADELDTNNYPIDELVNIMTSDENIDALIEEGIDKRVAKGILTYMAIISPIAQGLKEMSIYYMPYQLEGISSFGQLWSHINRYGAQEGTIKIIYERLQKSRYGINFDLGMGRGTK